MVPKNKDQFNSSVENDAKQYVQSRVDVNGIPLKVHTCLLANNKLTFFKNIYKGLFELQMLQFKELAKIKVDIAALSNEKKNILTVDSITTRNFLPVRDMAK